MRERITVATNDTLDQVLERLRGSAASEVVLDVDPRSPLLISLPHLHRLDEAAQEVGVQVAIASANSKLLNAARVFGLDVIDTSKVTDDAPAPLPVARGELLAGQPLGSLDTLTEPAGREGVPPAAPPPATVPTGVGADSDQQSDDWGTPTLPVHDSTDSRPPAQRLDPYGQPYSEHEMELPDRRAVSSAVMPDEEGWDDELPEEQADDEWHDAPSGRFRESLASFWADVRARVQVTRQRVTGDDALDDEWVDDVPEQDEWDEPPYRARQSAEPSQPTPEREVMQPLVIRPPRARPTARDDVPKASPGRQSVHLASAAVVDDDEDWEDWQEEPRRARRSWSPVGFLVAGLAVLLAGLLVLYVLLPTATVTLVAHTATVTTDFNVVVGEIDPNSPQGQPTPQHIVIPAKRLIIPVSASATRPATGARLEPDVTAGGPVVLSNASTEAVTVAKGTSLAAVDGRGYITLEEVTVGPADPFNAGAFGTATVKVAAESRGSGGNAPIGAVRGRLANGIYYNNRVAPIAGGTDRRIQTIAEQDLANANAAAEAAARAQGQAAINGAIPAGGAIMHDTGGVSNFKATYNAKAGADGDSVTATVNAEATVLVYFPATVETASRAEAERRLAAAAKPGEPIVAGSMQIAPPQVVEDVPGQLTYRLTGSARTRAAIGSDTERQQLARELAHQSDDDARAILARLPGVSSATIEYHTGPFPEWMPWLASHITVRLAEDR